MSISPEFIETGRYAGRKTVKVYEKSNFSQTCNLLSQYLKEKGSFGDLSFGSSSPCDLGKSPAMDLFPQHTGFAEEAMKTTEFSAPMPKPNQMTIIYGGKVLVFDDVAEEKVKELMMFAGKGSPQINPTNLDLNAGNNVNSAPDECLKRPPIQAHVSVSGLPLARKASLHRFLEKRKDRISARAPYQVNMSAATTSKPEETKTWLGLASQSSVELRL
ncbi:hypothetical protein IFM89_028517 [Coptis chinensis]|uniref:Protein TIFY n=1 Tax=Coptis chinensis TaxID=261450 RepID=A0A835IDY2_9MAGN|nr:hypothetical protein IFM89_028517 [Coptis chinensis]